MRTFLQDGELVTEDGYHLTRQGVRDLDRPRERLCQHCGVVLHPLDSICGMYCSPECCEEDDEYRCPSCGQIPMLCECERWEIEDEQDEPDPKEEEDDINPLW